MSDGGPLGSLLALVACFGDGYLAYDDRRGDYCLIVALPEGKAGWHVTDDQMRHLQLHGVPVIDADEAPPSADATERAVRKSVISKRFTSLWLSAGSLL